VKTWREGDILTVEHLASHVQSPVLKVVQQDSALLLVLGLGTKGKKKSAPCEEEKYLERWFEPVAAQEDLNSFFNARQK